MLYNEENGRHTLFFHLLGNPTRCFQKYPRNIHQNFAYTVNIHFLRQERNYVFHNSALESGVQVCVTGFFFFTDNFNNALHVTVQ